MDMHIAKYDDVKKVIGNFRGYGVVVIEVLTEGNDSGIITAHEKVISTFRDYLSLPKEKRAEFLLLSFGGWDHDKRGLHQIPECRDWCRRLVDEGGPHILSAITCELVADEMGLKELVNHGIGLLRVLVIAGYGNVTCPDYTDHSVEGIGKPNGYPNVSMTYELSPEGKELLYAVLLQQLGSAS